MTAKLKAHLYCTAAVAMFVCSGAAFAQDTDEPVETVVVTGQRAAIQSAISIKEKADVIVDSVAAEDVGKLPDNSITEVLQRLPGVNISRIQTGSGSENYLGEGTGVTIRGLTSTVSLINGRDSFSAASGRNLAWEDVPPELAQGIDVYKSLSASLPEGGFGGVVNLRTRQPFDFDGFTANLTLTGNYADNSKKGHLGGVAMVSDRWQTDIGEIGLLFNIAYSDLNTLADGVQVLPYYPVVYNPTYAAAHSDTLPSLSDSGSSEVYVPGGIGFTRSNDDRVRLGVYAAAQWRPNEDMLLFATYFRSRYTMNSINRSMYLGSGTVSVLSPDSTNTFDSYGNMTSTTGLSSFMYGFSGIGLTSEGSWGYEPVPYNLQTRYSHAVNTTTDISVGGEWHPSDKLGINFALQYIDSTATQDDTSAALYIFIAGYSLQLSSYGDSTLPKMTMADDTVDLTNAANFGWLATMPHKMDNHGKEYAAYVDGIYDLSDDGLLRKVRAGVKLTYREERDNETTWNYRQLAPYWGSNFYYMSDDTSWGEKVDLSGLFNGEVGLPSAVWFPSVKAARSPAALQSAYGTYDEDDTLAKFGPGTDSYLQETSFTAYAALEFAGEDYRVPFNGNVGVRIVAYRDHGAGYRWTPNIESSYLTPVTNWIYSGDVTSGTCAVDISPYTAVDSSAMCSGASLPDAMIVSSESQAVFYEGGHSQVDVLPSLNIQFLPLDNLHLRFAFSQGVNRPTFQQMNPRGAVYGNYVGTYVSYFSGNWGDPTLKPEKAEQLDFSAEYYFKSGGMVHFSAFYKNIHNYISTKQESVDMSLDLTLEGGATDGGSSALGCTTISAGSTCAYDLTASVVEYFNEKENATVDGFEIGIQKYADFLPDPFNGFGIDINYTYIDSSQPGALAYDMLGNKIDGLPLTGLSKNTVNAAIMYDKEALSVRLAYNWRDDFLVSTAAWQTAGNYNYINDLNYAGQDGTVVHFALPVFQYPSGSLDANLTYKLTDNISWTIEASNLTRTNTRLYMGVGDRRVNRSWYQADTRYTTQLRVKF